jgi:type IX secretion system PorP/SprF family membrane protein
VKRGLSIVLFLAPILAWAQQYPFWTQYRSNLFMLNPAVAGTRQDIDARLSYRNQWVGFEGAPKTMGVSYHQKLYKNKMGLGGFVFQDQIGPFKNITTALAYAFKIKFDDVALSLGLNGSYNMQQVTQGFMTYQNTQDLAITNVLTTQKAHNYNAAAGVMLYNDRFYVAASMNNLIGSSFTYDKTSKGNTKYGVIQTVSHICLALGYNYSANPDYVWENSILANMVSGTPILFDYNLRLHIKHGLMVGGGFRLGTAVVAQVGWTFEDWVQLSYSYDFGTNHLRSTNSGSHEVKIVIFHNKAHLDHHKGVKEFQKQKFQQLL